jgi:hypothetical protein
MIHETVQPLVPGFNFPYDLVCGVLGDWRVIPEQTPNRTGQIVVVRVIGTRIAVGYSDEET